MDVVVHLHVEVSVPLQDNGGEERLRLCRELVVAFDVVLRHGAAHSERGQWRERFLQLLLLLLPLTSLRMS